MTAKGLELECPGCHETLELDRGFAGGVCRCSKCGTLMTVPADPAHGRAQRLARPEAPDAVAPRTNAPPTPPGNPRRRDRPESSRRGTTAHKTVGEQNRDLFTTASGQTVRIDTMHIPTAHQRPMARYLTYGLFILAVALLIGLCVLAATIVFSEPAAAVSR